MTRSVRSGRTRIGGLAAVAAVGVLAAGCDGAKGRQTSPPATAAPAPAVPAPPAGEPARADERRPQRVSFLTRAESCERFAEAVRPLAVRSVTAFGFNGAGGFGGEDFAAGGAAPMPTAAAPAAAEGRAAGAGTAAAPAAGVDFSGTNVQEAGVDEPDVVETDGRLLVTTADQRLRVVDVSKEPRQVGSLALPGAAGANLLLAGSRVLVFSSGFAGPGQPAEQGARKGGSRPRTTVTVVDLADPAKPTVARTHTIDGSYVDARLVGGVARIVTRSQPDIPFPQPSFESQADAERAQAANAEAVRTASPAAFLPKGASCADAYVPVSASGVGSVAVQSLDPTADAPGPAVTVVANASTVYASANRLFVATNPSSAAPVAATGGSPDAPARTAIHAFDITDPAKARYAGSGDVPGRLLNQFSLSEHDGVLRVATTMDGSGGGGPVPLPAPAPVQPTAQPQPGASSVAAPDTVQMPQSQSRVTVLRQAGEEWVETGAVDGLGKGERIYAVRFLGATGYVVTFRQVDPLYVIDLRDVRAPKVTGELKITGYSAYLHPAGDRRLLGIGQEATEQGRRVGIQLSLFDVGDPAAPTKLAGAVLPSASSSAEDDHHALLYWPASGLVVAPVQSYGTGDDGQVQRPFVGAVAFRIGHTSVVEVGRIVHPGQTPIERSLVVADRLLTLSRVGVAVNDVGSLADGGFLTFR